MYILLFLRLEENEAKDFYKGSNTKHKGKGWYGQEFVDNFLKDKKCDYTDNESLKGKIKTFYKNAILTCFKKEVRIESEEGRIKPEEIIVKVNEFTNGQITQREIEEAL